MAFAFGWAVGAVVGGGVVWFGKAQIIAGYAAFKAWRAARKSKNV